jgi:hypothetical protein
MTAIAQQQKLAEMAHVPDMLRYRGRTADADVDALAMALARVAEYPHAPALAPSGLLTMQNVIRRERSALKVAAAFARVIIHTRAGAEQTLAVSREVGA